MSEARDYRTWHATRGPAYDSTFDEWPYRRFRWRLEQQVIDEILATEVDAANARYLDFACGTGRIVGYVAPKVKTAVGVDINESMLEIARRKYPGQTFVNADLTRQDAVKDQYDLITAFRFFPNAEPALRKAALGALLERLAPSGVLVFNNHMNPQALAQRALRALGRAPDHSMRPAEVPELLAGSGLRITRTYGVGLLPFTDKRPPMPEGLMLRLETALTKHAVAPELCHTMIYVARR